jgi:hypothetical protein
MSIKHVRYGKKGKWYNKHLKKCNSYIVFRGKEWDRGKKSDIENKNGAAKITAWLRPPARVSRVIGNNMNKYRNLARSRILQM